MPAGQREGGAGTRRAAILQASAGVFLRYGYRKTSMDDLARAVGLSRQGLYLHFATKDAIFRESIVLLTEQSLQVARAALDRAEGSVEERLLDAFVGLASHSELGLMSRELLVELMVTATELAGPVVAAFEEALLGDFTRGLRAGGVATDWKQAGLSAKELARHLLAASQGIKQSVRSAADYREQMQVAVRLVCRGHARTTAG